MFLYVLLLYCSDLLFLYVHRRLLVTDEKYHIFLTVKRQGDVNDHVNTKNIVWLCHFALFS